MNFKNSKLIKLFAIFLLVLGILKPVDAATPNPSGLTGQYSCVINKQHGPFNTKLNGSDGVGILVTSFFDFTKNSGSMILTMVNGFGTKTASSELVSIDFTFSETKHATAPNSYLLALKLSDNETTTFLSMPVNSKNTVLITSLDVSKAPWTGVCQKL